jgi:hypothetical protein
MFPAKAIALVESQNFFSAGGGAGLSGVLIENPARPFWEYAAFSYQHQTNTSMGITTRNITC